VKRIGLSLLVCITIALSVSVPSFGQEQNTQVQPPVKFRFVVLTPHFDPNAPLSPSPPLQQWNGSFTFNGTPYPYVMVGVSPYTTNASATIPTYIIPIQILITGGYDFNPLTRGPFGALARTLLSPIFDTTTTYIQGGVDVGTTQYVDAYQRANFWSVVGTTNPNNHMYLGNADGTGFAPTVLPLQTLNVPPAFGTVGDIFPGHLAGLVDINYFDGELQAIISSFSQIQPNAFPIAIVNDVYLTEGGGCCIGGYHNAFGNPANPQTYAMFDYVDFPGDFSQDVSALSHEVAEWADDPLTNGFNNTPCGILEVGDPLEGTMNYGGYPYPLHEFTYNLQDLVFLRYFDAPADTSVNDWWSFQDYPFKVPCQNGSEASARSRVRFAKKQALSH